jgi:hypothetical protein
MVANSAINPIPKLVFHKSTGITMPGSMLCRKPWFTQLTIIEKLKKKKMNNENQNKATESSSKFAGALPFILIFGGITVAMILIKLLMNLFS